jgi:hypothetical protein
MPDDRDNGRLGSPRFSPWPAARPALFPLRPCVRFLGPSLRAVGSLPGRFCVSNASLILPWRHLCVAAMQYGRDSNAIWLGLFPRESELRQMSHPNDVIGEELCCYCLAEASCLGCGFEGLDFVTVRW